MIADMIRLVVGNVNGSIAELFEKLATLSSKTKFSFALIAGNLFADPETATNEDVEAVSKLLDGSITVPLMTYFALGTHALPSKVLFKINSDTGELCPNLYFLGRRATTKTSEGIRIASLGGQYDASTDPSSKDIQQMNYSDNDAKSLKGAHLVDILITSDWPEGVRKGSQVEFTPGISPAYQPCIADLCLALKPKYHFTTSQGTFYEREPFFHPSEEETETFRITRFISLAEMGNTGKQKWIYAFSIDPQASEPISLPTGTTTCPLSSSAAVNKKRTALSDQQSYRFSTDPSHSVSQRPRKRRREHAPIAPAECFFCLSNPALATHLIASIGESAYMTVAKGPLSLNTTFPTLPFPAHMLIIPLNHSPMLSSIENEEERQATEKEMKLFVTSLNTMLRKQAPKLGAVSWSVSRASGVHVHWQWMPVPLELVEKKLVEAAFRVEAENEKYSNFAARKVDESNEKEDSFIVRIWNLQSNAMGDEQDSFKNHKALYLPLDASFRFDLQFGRRVIAKLLELDNRADWRQCGQSQEDEEKDVENFKNVFKDFDFTLVDDD
jgi:Protein similar to CwfJ C-terminus 1/Protein similar to CwfJ C-terminus 2